MGRVREKSAGRGRLTYGSAVFAPSKSQPNLEAIVYVLLLPPIAVAIALLLIGVRRVHERSAPEDPMEAHRRCLDALDPRSASRKAAQQARDESQAGARIRRHA
jgi:hypothetical protein